MALALSGLTRRGFLAKGQAGLRYKKLLIVCKESKLTRFNKTGKKMSAYMEQNYKS